MTHLKIRTKDDLKTLLNHECSSSWCINPEKHNLRFITIYNWNKTQKIVADYNFCVSDPRAEHSKRKIIYFKNAHIFPVNNLDEQSDLKYCFLKYY